MLENSHFGYVKDGKVYLKGYMNLPDREIGVVKETDEISMLYFIDRYLKVQQKIEDVASAILESPNKGSYLMKLIHMREYLSEYNGIGDFAKLYQRIAQLEDSIRDYVTGNRQKNLSIKQLLLEDVRLLKNSVEWDATADKFKDIKMRWIRTGSADKELEDNMCAEFDGILDDFFARRKAHFDNIKKEETDRMNLYGRLIYELRGINYAREKTPEHRLRVIAIQKEWKEVGAINKWKYVKIWRRYKREIDKFFGNKIDEEEEAAYQRSLQKRDYSRPNSNQTGGSYQGNRTNTSTNSYQSTPKPAATPAPVVLPEEVDLDKKRMVCENIENICDNHPETSLQEVKKIQVEWKALGIIPNNAVDKELNNRFRAACNEIFEHNFLIRDAKLRFEGFDTKTRFEQMKVKIKLLKESIKTEEIVLQGIERANPALVNAAPSPNQSPEQLAYQNQVNKIKTKKRLAKKLQNALESNFM